MSGVSSTPVLYATRIRPPAAHQLAFCIHCLSPIIPGRIFPWTSWLVLELVLHHVFRLHGLHTDVVSDRGPQFTSIFWREFCRLVGASVSLSSGFHPQSNGQTERLNQDLETTLRYLVKSNPASWSDQPVWVESGADWPSGITGTSPVGRWPKNINPPAHHYHVPAHHRISRND